MPKPIYKKFTKWLIYNTFIFGCLILLTIIAVSFSKDYLKSQKLKREIVSLQNDIAKNENKILELSEFLKYLDSESYAEKKARTELGLKKQGEKVVVIPKIVQEGDETAKMGSDIQLQKEHNIIKWWKYFFSKK